MRNKKGNAKLTRADVDGIRARVLVEKSTTVKIEAERFMVGRETIRRALRGETFWRDGVEDIGREISKEEIVESQKKVMEMLARPEEKKTPSFDPLKVWLEEGREALVEKIQNDPLRAYAVEPPPDDMPVNPLEEE